MTDQTNQHICFSGCRCGGHGTTVTTSWANAEPSRVLDDLIAARQRMRESETFVGQQIAQEQR